jgi:hypothetical protein
MLILPNNLDYVYTLKESFERAKSLEHNFLFAIDNPVPKSKKKNGKDDHGKLFNSHNNIHSFLEFYNSIPTLQRNFYEVINKNSPFYEYYDIEIKINDSNDSQYTNMNLFTWFDYIRSEFINFTLNNKHTQFNNALSNSNQFSDDKKLATKFNFLCKPNWIILTASSDSKLSLHLINKNAIFTQDVFAKYYNSFKSYVQSFVNSSHPFYKSIDWCVKSSNRQMRIIGSSKLKQNRPLTIYNEFHNEEQIPLNDTFITPGIVFPSSSSSNVALSKSV